MDLEQRIGRIHRYGQIHTAQVYNLVLSDTIEGRIYLLLDDKLNEIARALGKADEQGQVAEDFRSQILGQLSEKLNYERLYQDALSDPELKRTQIELETALANAKEARNVVFELFQALDSFSLEDYKPLSDVASGMERLKQFMSAALAERRWNWTRVNDETFDVIGEDGTRRARFTTNREEATGQEGLELLGLDHPLVREEIEQWRRLPPEQIGIAVERINDSSAILSVWLVETTGKHGDRQQTLQAIAMAQDGSRAPGVERQAEQYFQRKPNAPWLFPDKRLELFVQTIEQALQRELRYKGFVRDDGSYSAELIGYVEIG